MQFPAFCSLPGRRRFVLWLVLSFYRALARLLEPTLAEPAKLFVTYRQSKHKFCDI